MLQCILKTSVANWSILWLVHGNKGAKLSTHTIYLHAWTTNAIATAHLHASFTEEIKTVYLSALLWQQPLKIQ